jgi:ubiquinone/menaquinone biosynthesis C-methylase UbiE
LIELPQGARICDVSAGSGNYTNALAKAGFNVLAIEPSSAMRDQSDPYPHVSWLDGSADGIPLADSSTDAVVCALAAHHFPDVASAVREMDRICPDGPLVFFTMDPRLGGQQWFSAYFPEIRQKDFELFPSVSEFAKVICEATGRWHEVETFPLPADLTDQCMYASWATPETYLQDEFRRNTSGFAMANPELVQKGLEQLVLDLSNGDWEDRFGRFRNLDENDAGFRFVRFIKS